MTITREDGQSVESHMAYRAYWAKEEIASDARSEEIHIEGQIARLQKELRAARKATKAARAAAKIAEDAYFAIPYSESV